eukprot:m.20649 g.20649  ORF g.20649 m.20649 type:complete len:100 (+) comp8598_c0_seq3:564-863(+)
MRVARSYFLNEEDKYIKHINMFPRTKLLTQESMNQTNSFYTYTYTCAYDTFSFADSLCCIALKVVSIVSVCAFVCFSFTALSLHFRVVASSVFESRLFS